MNPRIIVSIIILACSCKPTPQDMCFARCERVSIKLHQGRQYGTSQFKHKCATACYK